MFFYRFSALKDSMCLHISATSDNLQYKYICETQKKLFFFNLVLLSFKFKTLLLMLPIQCE